ncbi:MAG: hypothetical protein AAGA48_16535 [Myxococcota bacterium]
MFRSYALAATWLGLSVGCSGGDPDVTVTDDPTEPPKPTVPLAPLEERALDVIDVWEALAQDLRESPDHRMARAREAIATGNPETMFDFVRDRVGLLPLTEDDWSPTFRSDRTAWFGARGAIRGGLGTPRDRAEALAWMLDEAGFETQVHWAYPADAWAKGDAQWTPRDPGAFDPPQADLTAWSAPWQGDLSAHAQVVDADGQRAAELASALTGLVEPGPPIPRRDVRLMPVVEVVIDDQEVLLNVNDSLATFEDPRTEGHAETGVLRTPEVTMRIWARQAGTGDEVTLVEGAWPVHDLVGRRVVFRSRPVLDLSVALGTPIGEIPLFLPSLSVEGLDEDLGALGAVGAPFARTADRFAADPATDEPRVNGRPIDTEPDDDALVQSVARLEVNADPLRFPEVALTLRPFDRSGDLVQGLGGRSFTVTDEGQPVGALLRSNVYRPRVIVQIDGSFSIPDEWREEAILPFAEDLAAQVLGLSGAEIVAQMIGQIPAIYDDFTSDVDTFVDQVADQASFASSVWTSLDRAVARRPDLVIVISDFAATDERTPAIEYRLRNGDADFLGIGVGPVEQETLEAIVALTGGAAVTPEDAADAIDAALGQLDPLEDTYELTYTAPPGPGVHEVQVNLGEVGGTTSYVVPSEPALGRGFAGLYATIDLEGRGGVTRTLAGLAPETDAAMADRAVIDQVEGALHGTVSLVVEGGGPGLSTVLEEELQRRVNIRNLVAQMHDETVFYETLRTSGLTPWPLEPMALTAALADDGQDGWTVPLGPRFVLHTLRPGFAPGDGLRRVDLLPLQRWMTVHPNPDVAWSRTFSRTLQLAVLEQATHEVSTITALEGESLVGVPAEALPKPLADDPRWLHLAEGLDDRWTLIVPDDGEPVAAWGVHEPTGTVLGLLQDGIGGGESIEEQVARNRAIIEQIASLHGLSGLGGGVWLELEVAKSEIVAFATLAIANLGRAEGGTGGVPSPDEVVEGLICSTAEGVVTDALPASFAEALGRYNEWGGALGLPPASVCP